VSRPQWAALVREVEAGRADVVIVAEMSRATRRLSEVGLLLQACADTGTRLVVGGREVDPTRPGDIILASIEGGQAMAESESSRKRTLRGMHASAASGKPHGRNLFGYRRMYDPATGALLAVEEHPVQGPVVRSVFSQFLAGTSLATIAQANGWPPSRVRRVLTNAAYIGVRVRNDREEGRVESEAMWPALVTVEQFDRAAGILADPKRRTSHDTAARWLLSGTATCAACGAPLGSVYRRGARRYVCSAHGCVGRIGDELDLYVTGALLTYLSDPAFAAAFDSDDDATGRSEATQRLDGLRAQLARIEANLANATTATATASLLRVLDRLAGDIEQATADVARASMPGAVRLALADREPADIVKRWKRLDIADRRSLLRALLTVTVAPLGRGKAGTAGEGVEVVARVATAE
jgi:site-specific DNA recombinase